MSEENRKHSQTASANIKQKHFHAIDVLLLLGLIVLTFYPLLFTGYLTADDTERHLAVMTSGFFSELWGIAEATGRITLSAHFFLTHIAYLFDSYIYRKFFLILPHIVVLALFSVALNKYVGRSVSLVFLTCFFAFFTNSWEHDLYGAYPFAFHVSIASMILSCLFLLKYLEHPQRKNLIIAVVLFCVAIFTYEQFLAYIIFLLIMIFLSHGRENDSLKNSLMIALPFIFAIVVYLIVVFSFKHILSGSYPGTTIAAFDVGRFLKTLSVFVSSAFPLYIPFHYIGRINHGWEGFGYSISDIFAHLQYIWVTKAVLVSTLMVRGLYKSDYNPTGMKVFKHLGMLSLLLISSVLLISLSDKYQHWVIESGTLAYSSPSYVAQICAAGLISLALCYLANRKMAGSLRVIFYGLAIVGVSYVVLVTEMHNDDVLAAQRNSANKWAAIERLYKSGDLSDLPKGAMIYAPNFIQTGGIVSVREGYWASFLAIKYDLDLHITGQLVTYYNPMYVGKRYELKYDSHYPNVKYSIVLKRNSLPDYYAYIPNYEKTGFYGKEVDAQGHLFQWSKKASSLFICNGTKKDTQIEFTAVIRTDRNRAEPLTICFLHHCNDYRLSLIPTKVIEHYVLPAGCHSIDFRTKAVAVNAPNDPRSLYFNISNVKLSEM